MESPPKEKSCTLPTTKTKKEKKLGRVVVGGGVFGVFGSSLHEGWPGVGVVETVNVGVQNDLIEGWRKSCAEIVRHRRRCDLPCATGGGTAESGSASSVVCLREVVVGLLATAGHGVETRASGDKS
jgi:hypothetical protein